MRSQSSENPEHALVRSIALPDLQEVIGDVGEAYLDQILDEGVLRDIPIIASILRLRATVGAVRDYVFTRKVARFLMRVGSIPVEERQRFIDSLSSVEERQRVGETLLALIDRMDDLEKPYMLATLFAAYIGGRYDYATFRRLATALDRLSLQVLPSMRQFYAKKMADPRAMIPPDDELQEIALAGLARIHFSAALRSGGGRFEPNDLGRLFLDIINAA